MVSWLMHCQHGYACQYDCLGFRVVIVIMLKAFMVRWRAEHRWALSMMKTRRYHVPSPCNNRRPDVCAICLEEFSVKQVRFFWCLSHMCYVIFCCWGFNTKRCTGCVYACLFLLVS